MYTYGVAIDNKVRDAPSPHWGTVIKARRKELGISQEELALRADVSPSLITKIERGSHPITKMSVENVMALISALEWSSSQFAEHTSMQLPLNTPEAKVTKLAPDYLENIRRIPLYHAVDAGPGGEGGEILEYVDIPADWSGDYVAYKVNGNSMEPTIPHSSVVICRVQDTAELGETVVAYCPDRGMLVKTLQIDTEEQRRAVLSSKNPDYADIFVGAGCRIYGKVVEVRRRL